MKIAILAISFMGISTPMIKEIKPEVRTKVIRTVKLPARARILTAEEKRRLISGPKCYYNTWSSRDLFRRPYPF